ncbi:DUF3349 domain-containing protein [Cutibacterium acnes]
MSFTDSTRSVLAWLRAEGAGGCASHDLPVVVQALERTRLTDGEIALVVRELSPDDSHTCTRVDAAVAITHLIDALPHPDDLARVSYEVAALGHPLSDAA